MKSDPDPSLNPAQEAEQPLSPNQNSGDLVADQQLEQELFAELKNRGKDGLAEFFVANRDRLHRMISLRLDQRLSQRVDASDILQEGFLDASRRLQEFLDNPAVPLIVWVRFLVGQQLAAVHRHHFKAQKRDPRKEALPASQRMPSVDSQVLADEFSAHLTTPSEAVSKAETTRQMLHFLNTLEPVDREILVMRHFEELSNNEAAAELDIPKGTASKRYMRALAKLNRLMSNNQPSSVTE